MCEFKDPLQRRAVEIFHIHVQGGEFRVADKDQAIPVLRLLQEITVDPQRVISFEFLRCVDIPHLIFAPGPDELLFLREFARSPGVFGRQIDGNVRVRLPALHGGRNLFHIGVELGEFRRKGPAWTHVNRVRYHRVRACRVQRLAVPDDVVHAVCEECVGY